MRAEIKPLTSLRGIAAFAVMLHHYRHSFGPNLDIDAVTPILAQSNLWVDFFFVLSGFILAEVHGEEFAMGARWPWRDYMSRRLARIYPLHLLVLGAFVALELVRLAFGGAVTPAFSEGRSGAALVSNLLLVHAWGFHDGMTWNYPSWSISTELVAYLLFPFLVALAVASRLGTLALGLVAVAVICVVPYGYIGPNALAHCVAVFALGVVVRQCCQLWPLTDRQAGTLLAVCLLALVVVLHLALDRTVFILLAALAVLAAAQGTSPVHRLISLRPLHWLGVISYSVYMVHAFVQQIWLLLQPRIGPLNGWQAGLMMLAWVALVLLISMWTYRVVEVPARIHLLRLLAGGRAAVAAKPASRQAP